MLRGAFFIGRVRLGALWPMVAMGCCADWRVPGWPPLPRQPMCVNVDGEMLVGDEDSRAVLATDCS